MNSTLTITIDPRQAVPTEGRAAWLNQHGVLPASATITVTAPIALWERAGAGLTADGLIDNADRYSTTAWLSDDAGALREHLLETIRAQTRATGHVPESLSATVLDVYVSLRETARETKRAQERAEDAAKAAERAAEVAAIRARGLEAILRVDTSSRVWTSTYRPDSRTRIALVNEALGDNAYTLADAEAERRTAHEAEERHAARVPYDAALREVAARYDELARAAAENYPIERAVLDRLAGDLADVVGSCNFEIGPTTYDAPPPDRAAPTPAAFALRDSVVAAANAANDVLPSAIGTWVVSRIVRVDVCPHSGESHFVTGVYATLRTPFALREVLWSTESLACSHGDDEEEEN
jgi:hypothetical protein